MHRAVYLKGKSLKNKSPFPRDGPDILMKTICSWEGGGDFTVWQKKTISYFFCHVVIYGNFLFHHWRNFVGGFIYDFRVFNKSDFS